MSDVAGFRHLRQLLIGAQGVGALARAGKTLVAMRETRADQYGIRTIVEQDNTGIKFGVVFEGRIEPCEVTN